MSSAAWLATLLDQEMLEVAHGVVIAPRRTSDPDLEQQWKKTGTVDETFGKNISRIFGRFYKCYWRRKGYREGKWGFLIALMGCYQGYHSRGGAEGVGAATTAAVVSASILILAFDYVLTEMFFAR